MGAGKDLESRSRKESRNNSLLLPQSRTSSCLPHPLERHQVGNPSPQALAKLPGRPAVLQVCSRKWMPQRRHSGAPDVAEKKICNSVPPILYKFLIYVFLSNNRAVHCLDTLRSGAHVLPCCQTGGIKKERSKRSKRLSNHGLVALANPTCQEGRPQNKREHASVLDLGCRSLLIMIRNPKSSQDHPIKKGSLKDRGQRD